MIFLFSLLLTINVFKIDITHVSMQRYYNSKVGITFSQLENVRNIRIDMFPLTMV